MLGITFRQLQVFVETVEAGSFRLCAERLGMAQVSVSDHIRALEKQLGRPLFTRRRGAPAGLNDDGRRAYERSIALLAQANAFLDEFLPVRPGGARRKLVLGAPGYVSFRLSHALADFGLSHPELQLEVEVYDHESLLEGLPQGRVDVGLFLTLEDMAPPGSVLLWREPLALYIGALHPLANRASVDPADLREHPFIYLPERHQLRGLMDSALSRIGVSGSPVALQTENAVLARRSVIQGHGFGCFFENMVPADIRDGDLQRLPLAVGIPPLEVRMLVRPARRGDRAVQQLTAFLALWEDSQGRASNAQ